MQLKSLDFDEHMILPEDPCGHFALGTLSETCSKDAAFEVNARRQKMTRMSKIPEC